jgi:regulator of protease activity HflC (stomatin/prohibitin superfamily)
MSALLAIIGVILFLGVIALKIFVFRKIKVKWVIGLASIGIICIGLSGAFFYAKPGYSYMVQYPWGTQVAKMKPGYNTKWWGDTIPFSKIITVRKTHRSDKTSDTPTTKNNATRVRFMDTVQGKASLTARFRTPTNERQFINMAVDFKSQENLINNTLEPHTMESVKNAARELTAQDYVSGAASTFESNFQDQLTNGIVILTRETKTDAKKRMTIVNEGQREIQQNQVIVERVKRAIKKDGTTLRKPNPLIEYGITVTQALVEHVEPHPDFAQRLKAQMAQAAEANLERLKAQKAEQEKRRIIAEGEAKKANEQVKMEMEQVIALTKAETQKKQELINKEQAEITLEKEKLRAESITVIAKAKADARKLQMQADGSLEQKLKAWVEAQEVWAGAIGDKKLVPDTVIGNDGNKTSANQYIDLLMANQAKQLGLSAVGPQ